MHVDCCAVVSVTSVSECVLRRHLTWDLSLRCCLAVCVRYVHGASVAGER